MKDRPMGEGTTCEEFLEQLEQLPSETPGAKAVGDWRESLPEGARAHAGVCAKCEAALEDFVETRLALQPMKRTMPEPGPWFASRVMATIRAQEREIEEQDIGFWIGVRKLAPRLAAFAVLLLLVGGTWALELRRAEETRRNATRPVEGLFESAPNSPLNDDIVASTYEERR